MNNIKNQTFDEERALYGSEDITIKNCRFDGPADGESALKESRNITVDRCFFNLRYPFWHDHNLVIRNSEMTELCRAALWYSEHIEISDTKMHGIKAVRECHGAVKKQPSLCQSSSHSGWALVIFVLIYCFRQ